MTDNLALHLAEFPSPTHFEKYVVEHIQKLLSGQERLERLLSVGLHKDQCDVVLEDKAISEQGATPVDSERCTIQRHSQKSTSLQWRDSEGGRAVSRCNLTERHSKGFRITATMSIRQKTTIKWPGTLPATWPKSLSLNAGFQRVDDNEEEVKLFREQFDESLADRHLRRSWKSLESLTLGPEDDTSEFSTETAKRCALVLMPTHPVRLFLDTVCMVCLAADMIMVPWILAWDIEAKGPLKLSQFIIMMYWSMDIFFSFLSAYVSDGKIVTDLRRIATHYLLHGFALDLLIVAVDWLSFFEAFTTNESAKMAKGMRIGKLSRLIRIVAVFRMSRVSQAYHRLVDYCTVRGLSILITIFDVFNLLIIIVYINHVLGCCWYALSKYAPSDTGASWLDTRIVGRSETYEDVNLFFQYTSAFHWSLTQMTPGSMQVQAQNSPERVFNIICLVFGVLFFGTLISTLSAKMMDVKRDKLRTRQMKKTMMKFLQERQVSPPLALLVKKHVEERMSIRSRLVLHDIDAFNFLSGRLLSEVHLAICKPCLSQHPLFVAMSRLNEHVFKEVCFHAMKFHAMSSQDILFTAGGHCSECFIVSEGTLVYTQDPISSFVLETTTRSFHTGTWFCEAALWCEWIHLGTADCAQAAEMLKISSVELIVATRRHIVLSSFVLNYAAAYHKHLVVFRRAETLTDYSDDPRQTATILCHLGENWRMILNSMSLKIFHESYGWYGSYEWRRLKAEVTSKRTTLVPITNKDILRCVEVSCLKLVRDDGCIFTGVGTWNALEEEIEPRIMLPGSKLMNCEDDPEVALERVLTEDLGSLGDVVLLSHLTVENTLNFSGVVHTDYSKNIFEAILNPDTNLASWLTKSQPVSSAQDKETHAAFYYFEDRQNRKQVYAWISPHDFDAARDGSVDIIGMLKNFDWETAIDLNTSAVVEDVEEEQSVYSKHSANARQLWRSTEFQESPISIRGRKQVLI